MIDLQIRAFASNPHSTSKQELNQSPLAFIESASEPGLEEALKRKDNIIRVRNAQISALWDELHTRQPWKNAIKGEDIVTFPEDAANTTRKLAVLGINTVSAAYGLDLESIRRAPSYFFVVRSSYCSSERYSVARERGRKQETRGMGQHLCHRLTHILCVEAVFRKHDLACSGWRGPI